MIVLIVMVTGKRVVCVKIKMIILKLILFLASLTGNTGVIHFIESWTDIDWIVRLADAGPYIPVVSLKDFNRFVAQSKK